MPTELLTKPASVHKLVLSIILKPLDNNKKDSRPFITLKLALWALTPVWIALILTIRKFKDLSLLILNSSTLDLHDIIDVASEK